MANYEAQVVWERGDQAFVDQRYSRRHWLRFDGGLEVPGSSSPHVVPLPWSDPAAVDPEEAYVAALSSCHMLWFMDFASRAGYRLNHYADAEVGTMAKNAQGQLVVPHVQLHPVTRFDAAHAPSAAQLDDLHHRAHTSCFLANSVKTQIDCAPVLHTEGA